MYEGDAPLADRRAQALALDRDLLRELLGADELRELLDRAAPWPSSSWSCRRSRRSGPPARPTRCTTCCAAWAT